MFLIEFIEHNSELLISILALIISLNANHHSRKSTAIAQSALDISKEEHQEKNLPFETYLLDAGKWKDDESFYFGMFVRFKNMSSQTNSISEVSICCCILNEKFEKQIIKLPPAQIEQKPAKWNYYPKQNTPIQFEPKMTIECCFYAKIPKKIIGDNYIESITLEAVTLSNETISVPSFSPKEDYV